MENSGAVANGSSLAGAVADTSRQENNAQVSLFIAVSIWQVEHRREEFVPCERPGIPSRQWRCRRHRSTPELQTGRSWKYPVAWPGPEAESRRNARISAGKEPRQRHQGVILAQTARFSRTPTPYPWLVRRSPDKNTPRLPQGPNFQTAAGQPRSQTRRFARWQFRGPVAQTNPVCRSATGPRSQHTDIAEIVCSFCPLATAPAAAGGAARAPSFVQHALEMHQSHLRGRQICSNGLASSRVEIAWARKPNCWCAAAGMKRMRGTNCSTCITRRPGALSSNSRRISRAEDTEEICQETFLSVIRNLESFHGESRFQTWLFRIAANKARDYREAPKRRQTRRWPDPALPAGRRSGQRPDPRSAGSGARAG